MDCIICTDPINKQTGIVTLSCEHSFHFRCIDEWFCRQINEDQHQTCPCCRSEGNGLDRGVVEIVEEEEEEDDDYEENESQTISEDSEDVELANMLIQGELRLERLATGEFLFTPVQDIVYDRIRNMFGPLNELDVADPAEQEMAARKIQAVYRGYKARTGFETVKAARTLLRLFFQAYNI